MPVAGAGGAGCSGRALGWAWRPMTCGNGLPGGPALPADLDAGQVERVEDQLDLAQGQGRVDLVGVAVQRHRGGLADGAPLAPQERLVQLGGSGQRRRGAVPAVRPPLRGCLPGFGMHPAVIDRFCPRGEQPVQLADVGRRAGGRPGRGRR